LLAVESKRSERSGRHAVLLLVVLKEAERESRLDTDVATKLFWGLRACLRETDFVGWYRKDWVVGAVLTQLSGAFESGPAFEIGQKVTRFLCGHVPANNARAVDVQVYQLPSRQKLRSQR
jgi:hypothetical protein